MKEGRKEERKGLVKKGKNRRKETKCLLDEKEERKRKGGNKGGTKEGRKHKDLQVDDNSAKSSFLYSAF